MKTSKKQLSRGSLLGLSVLATAASFIALPISGSATTSRDRQSQFCSLLITATESITTDLSQRRSKAAEAAGNRDKNIASRQAAWDAEISQKRTEWSQKRTESFEKLTGKAKTDDQKAAVAAYKTAVLDAVADRQAANDKARATYRQALEALLAGRRTAVATNAEAYAVALAKAKATATASCASSPETSNTIRATLKSDLQAARQTYSQAHRQVTSNRGQHRELIEQRNETIRTNNQTFQDTLRTAREKLRQAFQNSSL